MFGLLLHAIAATLARLEALTHVARFHDVQWNGADVHCGEDIVCHSCVRLLWCRNFLDIIEDPPPPPPPSESA